MCVEGIADMKIKSHGSKLPLSNDGALSIYFIGTGSAFAKHLFQNNLVIVKGDEHLVIDCGTRCMEGLDVVGITAPSLDNFLITHTHADHIGGLEEVMLTDRYMANKKPKMIINKEFEDILWNMSLQGGCSYSEMHNGKPLGFGDFWQRLRPNKLKRMPRETWHYRLGDLDIKMPRTKHVPDSANSWKDSFWSCAVILDERVLFTSDTQYDPELVLDFDKLYDFEIIFHDCQFFTGGVHASLEELIQLPAHIKKKTLLMHYSDAWEAQAENVKKAGFKGFVKQSCSYVFP